jgi:hypothetical protein
VSLAGPGQAGGTAWREVVRRWRVPVCDACDRDLDYTRGHRGGVMIMTDLQNPKVPTKIETTEWI